jgi:hypothetical protein
MAFCNCQNWPLACASRPCTAAVAASKSARNAVFMPTSEGSWRSSPNQSPLRLAASEPLRPQGGPANNSPRERSRAAVVVARAPLPLQSAKRRPSTAINWRDAPPTIDEEKSRRRIGGRVAPTTSTASRPIDHQATSPRYAIATSTATIRMSVDHPNVSGTAVRDRDGVRGAQSRCQPRPFACLRTIDDWKRLSDRQEKIAPHHPRFFSESRKRFCGTRKARGVSSRPHHVCY